MSAQPQGPRLVEVFSPKPTVLICMFPDGVELHGCVQNVVRLQVEDDQIILIRRPSQVLSDIIEGLQVLHREAKLIAKGKVERRLLELNVCNADLLQLALAPIVVAINSQDEFRAAYQNQYMRPVAAFA